MLFAPKADASSVELNAFANENGVKATLEKYSEYDGKYVSTITEIYNEFKQGRTLAEVVKVIDEKTGKKIIV